MKRRPVQPPTDAATTRRKMKEDPQTVDVEMAESCARPDDALESESSTRPDDALEGGSSIQPGDTLEGESQSLLS
jgi:hypothetical protein